MVDVEGFEELFALLLEGQIDQALQLIGTQILNELTSMVTENHEYLIELLLIALLTAFFSNLTSAFGGSLLGEQGYYVSFLMVFGLSVKAFGVMYALAEETLREMIEVMQVMIPAYMIAVTSSSGSMSGSATYQLLSMVLTCIQYVILYVIFPVLQAYCLFQFINQLNKEGYFSKWILLMKDGVQWGLKMITLFILGMHVLKGLIAPVIDGMQIGTIQKGISALPGGSYVAAFTGVFLGCSVLIKNCIGVAGILVLLGVVAVPLVQLGVMVLQYKIMNALLDPIIDKRLGKALSGMADAGGMLLRTVFTSVMLFIISIAMIASGTNLVFDSGG